MRNTWLRNYAVLAAVTIGIYGVWATGIAGRTGDFIGAQVTAATVQAGFTVQRVTFSGHLETSPGDVIDAMGVEIGAPILTVDLREARARIESLDWVDRATVVRALPGTIHVEIAEREPFAVWQSQGVLHVISADGSVIGSADAEAFSHLPHVVGSGAEREARGLFEAMETVPQIAPRVRYAVRVSDRRWDLHFDSGVVVQLPEDELGAALEALARYESEYRILARAIDEVDLRLGDRIVVRPETDGDGPQFALTSTERET
jgi:cell division protein FtsQ